MRALLPRPHGAPDAPGELDRHEVVGRDQGLGDPHEQPELARAASAGRGCSRASPPRPMRCDEPELRPDQRVGIAAGDRTDDSIDRIDHVESVTGRPPVRQDRGRLGALTRRREARLRFANRGDQRVGLPDRSLPLEPATAGAASLLGRSKSTLPQNASRPAGTNAAPAPSSAASAAARSPVGTQDWRKPTSNSLKNGQCAHPGLG